MNINKKLSHKVICGLLGLNSIIATSCMNKGNINMKKDEFLLVDETSSKNDFKFQVTTLSDKEEKQVDIQNITYPISYDISYDSDSNTYSGDEEGYTSSDSEDTNQNDIIEEAENNEKEDTNLLDNTDGNHSYLSYLSPRNWFPSISFLKRNHKRILSFGALALLVTKKAYDNYICQNLVSNEDNSLDNYKVYEASNEDIVVVSSAKYMNDQNANEEDVFIAVYDDYAKQLWNKTINYKEISLLESYSDQIPLSIFDINHNDILLTGHDGGQRPRSIFDIITTKEDDITIVGHTNLNKFDGIITLSREGRLVWSKALQQTS